MKTIAVISLAAVAANVHATDLQNFDVGFRVGTSINQRTETFRQVEGVVDYKLPWHWDLGSDFHLQSRLDFSAGWLHGDREDGFVGTLGPSAILSWKGFPVTLDVGSSPTMLSEHHFSNRDFGGNFQFTTHAGLNWQFLPHFTLSYRYQHMSNAGLYMPNPGLNMHMVGVSYQF